ncbi:MAG: hypothetical protein ACYTGN_14120 [Planctomycetota bacterium]|jgi:hypothetical protein
MRPTTLLFLALVAACAGSPKDTPGEQHFGAFYDRDERPEGTVTQVRPFYWKQVSKDGQTQVNILGPLILYREDKTFKRLQAFPNIFYTARKEPPEEATWKLLVFPFIWAGPDGTLVFPLAGISKGVLGFHELAMVMGPLYVRTKKISSGAEPRIFTTHWFMWPFISYGTDDQPGGRRRFAFFPFYGHGRTYGRSKGPGEGREPGDRELYILWPFFTMKRGRDIQTFHLWPFYGRRTTPILRETVILWPLYNYREDLITGGKDAAFWPFWRSADGSDHIYVRRYWPLYEYRRVSFNTTEYAAWPIVRQTYVDEGHQFSHYVWANPFYKHVRLWDREKRILRTKDQFWPIYRTDVDSEGRKDIKIPNLIPADAKLIRDFEDTVRPFTSVYSYRNDGRGEVEASAAFGVWMTRKNPKARDTRLLWGLLGWSKNPKGTYLRLLWAIRLRVGGPD